MVVLFSIDIWPLMCHFIEVFLLYIFYQEERKNCCWYQVGSKEYFQFEFCDLYMKTLSLSSSAIGMAADSWMALMDRLLTLRNDCTKEKEKQLVQENMVKLINIYYEALDAPKKGGGKVSLYYSSVAIHSASLVVGLMAPILQDMFCSKLCMQLWDVDNVSC